MSHIAVIGEAVADAFLPADRHAQGDALQLAVRPGGGPANTAVALSRLGTPTCFVARLSGGPLGRLLRHHLVASGVNVSTAVDAAEAATLAVTAIDHDGQAAYDFYATGTADWQWTADELAARVPYGASCVHTGSLALALTPGGPLIEDLLEQVRPRATVSIDPNVRLGMVPAEVYRSRLPHWTRLADILRLSDEDLEHLTPDAPVERTCDAWHADGVRLVVITRGAKDVLVSLDGERLMVPAVDIDPVDTVGAGDAFMAGMLHWLCRRGALGGRLAALTIEDVQAAASFGAAIAAETCKVPGADPPWAHHLAAEISALLPPFN